MADTCYLSKQFPPMAGMIKRAKQQARSLDDDTSLEIQAKILDAFTRNQVSTADLAGTTGYGYNDSGRDKLEAIFATLMGTEKALVRPQISSGTHALWLAISACTAPSEAILAVTGPPYATLSTVLDQSGHSLRCQDLVDGQIDLKALEDNLNNDVKLIFVQKSRGYSHRPAMGNEQIKILKDWLVKNTANPPLILVDNCYAEFVEDQEPGHWGADIVAGSLIKNPGGGLAHTGGYVAGPQGVVSAAGDRLFAPGLDSEIGATGNYLQGMFLGLFLAPHFVAQALKNARYAAALAEQLGIEALPGATDARYDIVQALVMGSERRLLAFCRAIQQHSPVDSFAAPAPGPVAGYQGDVVMAAGTFVQGASLELSADGPVSPPYTVYLQGGLGAEHGFLAITAAFAALKTDKKEGREG